MKQLWDSFMNDGAATKKCLRAILGAGGVAASAGTLPVDLPPWLAALMVFGALMIRAGKPEKEN